jgi:hypothetical protein
MDAGRDGHSRVHRLWLGHTVRDEAPLCRFAASFSAAVNAQQSPRSVAESRARHPAAEKKNLPRSPQSSARSSASTTSSLCAIRRTRRLHAMWQPCR